MLQVLATSMISGQQKLWSAKKKQLLINCFELRFVMSIQIKDYFDRSMKIKPGVVCSWDYQYSIFLQKIMKLDAGHN
jgi:hypothetical protein